MPTFVQISLGTGALVAGFSVATMTLGWPVAASLAGRVYLRWGFRTTSLLGAVIVALGAALLLMLDDTSTPWEVGAFCLVVGVGMGFSAVPTMVAAQSSVGWSERGVVTSANMFARSIGSAVGVAVYGAGVNATLGTHAGHPSGPELATAVHRVFVGVVAGAALLLVAVLLMPRKVPTDAVVVPADDGATVADEAPGQTVGGAA
ncbi:hypothetical protein GCM10025864_10560 [Luteimicrobium album]|uniref:Major facilitator superfamily (MFS) profile domain-containing protein n=1 Tax=Luteimicrobium album TaxID=1054550 RepID=A0ABQ6HZ95_9MICO|nr:hypothetical protein GCM10025864_10560 [Luteimicrobium album]